MNNPANTASVDMTATEVVMDEKCQHFWSAPTTAGTIACAWCGKIIPAPITWASDNTTTKDKPQPAK